ncbi:Uncharacterized [Moorella glycerini]|uniref:Uncharacterized protein n=1 Tax=Neomoorella stamsii TaxID=1266720 RepID=A0A9X7P4Z6_9FIRM|nr:MULTISPECIES: hypothetical protein [Moorella]PRR69588.1 hypothetical protein MOST_30100 [Moorella stamsii]CEP67888.1 Uncharacterized [Moorella glycerini]CEP68758.1 Uncharacterized [Moorella glycerini]
MSAKNIEERLLALEKEVAELKEQVSVQPEKVVEELAKSLRNVLGGLLPNVDKT